MRRDSAEPVAKVDAVEDFTPAERARLAPYFSNVDGPVFALVDLPETVKARDVRALLALPGHAAAAVPGRVRGLAARGRRAGGDVEGARAAELFERVFVGYGDDSVAQLGGAHIACEWVSNVLTKVLQRPRLAGYLEQSTRYIAYDAPMPGGGYRYYRDAALGPGVRGGDGRAVRRLRGGAAARERVGGRDVPGHAGRVRSRRAGARSRPRRSTCCAACCPPPRSRTWASTPAARPTSS